MNGKLSLDLNALAVESFEMANDTTKKGPVAAEPLATCLLTNCGKILCCA